MSSRIMCRIIWVPSLIVLICMFTLWTKRSTAIEPPAELVPFTLADKSVTAMYPKNWTATESGSHDVASGVRFWASKSVGLNINYDLIGSLVADLASVPTPDPAALGIPGAAPQPEVKQKSPLEKAHALYMKQLAKEYEEQEFQEGAVTQLTVGGLPAISTEYKYKMKSGWGSSGIVVGSRITVLTPERAASLTIYYPKEMKEQLDPVFNKMLASVTFGQGGQR